MASAARLGQARIPVPLVEDEVDHGQHRGQALGQLRTRRHAERDASHLDLGLSPGQPPFHRLGRDQEGARDLLGAQAAHGAQGQRDLGLGGQGRMAAHEDELESLVRDHRGLHLVRAIKVGRQQPELSGQHAVAAQPVDGPAAGRGDQPGGRVTGHPPDGQRRAAIANASAAASSARSKSPRKPISEASRRPHSSRKTCSIGGVPRAGSLVVDHDRPDLHRTPKRTAGIRAAISVARSMSSASSSRSRRRSLWCRRRAVGDEQLIAGEPDGGGRLHRVQCGAAGDLRDFPQGQVLLVDGRILLVAEPVVGSGVEVDQQGVLHGRLLFPLIPPAGEFSRAVDERDPPGGTAQPDLSWPGQALTGRQAATSGMNRSSTIEVIRSGGSGLSVISMSPRMRSNGMVKTAAGIVFRSISPRSAARRYSSPGRSADPARSLRTRARTSAGVSRCWPSGRRKRR